jgi:hypothetical protein
MSTVISAAPAAQLILKDTNPALFLKINPANQPCTVAVQGSAGFEMKLFSINVTGKVEANSDLELTMCLYAAAGYLDDLSGDSIHPLNYTAIAPCAAEPIGGATDFKETSWMVRGMELMYNYSTGKLQGIFSSNVADHWIGARSLEQNLMGIKPQDPCIVFAIGAQVDAVPKGGPYPTLTLCSFTMDA